MSSQSLEIALASARATVMIYDDLNKKWLPSGSSPGLSKVQLLQHTQNGTYRVVGRKIPDHEVVINCLLIKGLKYNQANQTFLQWRDSKQVYGLNFQNKDDAETFTQILKTAVDNLNKGAIDTMSVGKRSLTGDSNSLYEESMERLPQNNSNNNFGTISNQNQIIRNAGSATQLNSKNDSLNNTMTNQQQVLFRQNSDQQYYQQQQQQQQQQQINYQDSNQKIYDVISDSYSMQQNGINNKMNGNGLLIQQQSTNSNGSIGGGSVGTSAPPPPPPPPPFPTQLFSQNTDNTGAILASIGGPPPPPPPPIGGLNNGASFLEQSKNLKSTAKHDDVPSNMNAMATITTTQKSNQAPPQMDFLTEIRQKIGKKFQPQETEQNFINNNNNNNNNTNEKGSEELDGYKPSNIKKLNTNVTVQQKINTTHIDSPKTMKKIGSTTTVQTNGVHTNSNGASPTSIIANGNSNGTNNNEINYDKLKQEILSEMRKEMQIIKNDIINAIVSELRRNHI